MSVEVRPQYFVHKGEDKGHSESDDPDLRACGVTADGVLSITVTNFNVQAADDKVTPIVIRQLTPEPKHLIVHRVDEERHEE